VQADFAEWFRQSCPSGNVTEADFCSFYSEISGCLPAEKSDYFIQVVLKSWGLDSDAKSVNPHKLAQLQLQVFEKVRQRTHGADDEGKTLQKIMKHFDVEGYGTIGPKQFRQALETLGCTFADHEIDALFAKFDANGNGKVDYEEMASAFALHGSGNNPNVNPVFGIEREPPIAVLDKIRTSLRNKPGNGVDTLLHTFYRMDKNGSGKLDRHEFAWALKDNGHTLTQHEFERIFKFFDKNNDGILDLQEFMEGIRGEISQRKRAQVEAWIEKLRDGDVVDLDKLEAMFDGSQLPNVQQGRITVKELWARFRDSQAALIKDNKMSVDDLK
jgi:Ca2+-binding EF-hand superfamily protein